MTEITSNLYTVYNFVLEHSAVFGGIYLLWLGMKNAGHVNEQIDIAYDMPEKDHTDRVTRSIRQLEVRVWSMGWTFVSATGVVLIVV